MTMKHTTMNAIRAFERMNLGYFRTLAVQQVTGSGNGITEVQYELEYVDYTEQYHTCYITVREVYTTVDVMDAAGCVLKFKTGRAC